MIATNIDRIKWPQITFLGTRIASAGELELMFDTFELSGVASLAIWNGNADRAGFQPELVEKLRGFLRGGRAPSR
jgi:hypothetical protein